MIERSAPIISIIVPIYNTEKYLHRCVDSLLQQTISDIEIILVDDGSPDNSATICDNYAISDKRIKVIHKANGGLSCARNAGLDIAKGQYIAFVDSDDDVAPDMYMTMLSIADKYMVDMVITDYLRIQADGITSIKTQDIRSGLYNRNDIRDIIFPNLIMKECIDYGPILSVCNCLYRKSFLNKYNLRFDDKVKWSEDNLFSSILGYHCSSLYYLKGRGLYHYYNNPNSISTSYRKNSWVVYCNMSHQLHEVFDKVVDYDFSRQLKLHIIYYACNCINQTVLIDKASAINVIREIVNSNELKQAFKKFRLPKVNFKLKVYLLLMKYQMYRLIYHLKAKKA